MNFPFARAALPAIAFVVACSGLARAGVIVGPAAIAVAVRDANGKPVAGAQISLNGPTERAAVTDAAGVVTLQAVPLGVYSVRIARTGYEPYDATVRVVTAGAPTALPVQLASSSFANIASVANGVAAATSSALGAGSDPYAAHAVAVAPGTAIVPSALGAGVGVALDGASPDETRVELDGIPIAGGAQGYNALRFRDALPLTGVSIARG
ncbi:MAG: carboxypeptidase regulatory-like domain-containing protein, partial [Candidatus Eremiobacteraeota bacterium]|nr:carboxypeptidase regulatory-like domain-containing protein [Candidatus Eremiobacteraeota bacterium]